LVAFAGLWELIAAFTLGYSSSAVPLWNAIIVGIALVVLGAWAASANEEANDENCVQRRDTLTLKRVLSWFTDK
jgi:SPW repeat.